MNNKTPLREKIGDLLGKGGFLERVKNAIKKSEPDGLLAKIAQELPGVDAGMKPEIISILNDLFVLKDLDLPLDAVKATDFKPEFKNVAATLLDGLLTSAGSPILAIAGPAALAILKKRIAQKIAPCGVDKDASKVSGLDVDQDDDDRDVILYFVEEVGEEPVLPLVDGSRKRARGVLEKGFLNWAGKLQLDVSRVFEQDEANLIVTGEEMGSSTTVLARTEIGPPRGQQLRMVFNLSKQFTSEEFEANVAHEFGHALGIFHEDVNMDDTSLVMHGTNLGVKKPQLADRKAAEGRGWRPKA